MLYYTLSQLWKRKNGSQIYYFDNEESAVASKIPVNTNVIIMPYSRRKSYNSIRRCQLETSISLLSLQWRVQFLIYFDAIICYLLR